MPCLNLLRGQSPDISGDAAGIEMVDEMEDLQTLAIPLFLSSKGLPAFTAKSPF